MMVNEIVKGIAIQLNATFGDEYRAYQNDVAQGLVAPCFFIRVVSAGLAQMAGGRSRQHNTFDVMYFPEVPGSNAELCAMGDALLVCLAYITLPAGDLLRGTEMRYEIVDDILHLFVRFSHIRRKPVEDPIMEILEEVEVGVHRGGMMYEYQQKEGPREAVNHTHERDPSGGVQKS